MCSNQQYEHRTYIEAIEEGCMYYLQEFYNRGDDINFRNSDRESLSPLHAAALYDNIQFVQFLIERGADLDSLDCYGNTPLGVGVVENSSVEVLSMLVNAGSNIHHKNEDGDTALHLASLFGYQNIIKFLVECGADIQAVNNEGETPINIANKNTPEGFIQDCFDHQSYDIKEPDSF